MREIKFRGKVLEPLLKDDISTICFIEGSLINGVDFSVEGIETYTMIQPNLDLGNHDPILVDENTIGQFTGLYDMNGKEIYEGDVVKRISLTADYDHSGLPNGEYCCGWSLKEDIFIADLDLNYENKLLYGAYSPEVEECGGDFTEEDEEIYSEYLVKVGDVVIGNIYDNPELLGA